jgi:GH15 family glucan-1,4-alpha-glucosidase
VNPPVDEPRATCPRDADGFAALDDYGVLGDGRGAALVAVDGSVDWWASPHLDSPPVFAALLDPAHGGRIELRPVDKAASSEQRYVPGTNQLQTVFTTSQGRARVTDSLNSGNAGALPWSELARRVEGLAGTVEFRLSVQPGTGLRAWQPWVAHDPRGPIIHAGTHMLAVRADDDLDFDRQHERIDARFTVSAGERRVIGVVASDADPLYLCDVDAVDHRIDLTAAGWREWSESVRWDGPGRERILRSALALKTLVMAGTGAVAAAATTSLPERIGGPKNWDYRYSWVRDAALTINALSVLGLQEEIHAAVTWLLGAIGRNGPSVHVMYALDGDLPGQPRRPDVPGYKNSRPVNVGNRAADQTQLGVYGDLFETVAGWVFGGHALDVQSRRLLADLADRCADSWTDDDAGIWELTENRPYTSSKMNCWRALDAAARLAKEGHLPGGGQRWRGEAEVVRRWILEHCWSDAKQAYTFYAGSEDLDASVLLGAEFAFDRGPRMSSTIDAIGDELGAGPLLYRYSGVQDEENTFVACAYWRVHALACVGRCDEAERLLKELDPLVGGRLGLMSEMAEPGSGRAVGNLPQALSHLAHIRAAAAVLHAGP